MVLDLAVITREALNRDSLDCGTHHNRAGACAALPSVETAYGLLVQVTGESLPWEGEAIASALPAMVILASPVLSNVVRCLTKVSWVGMRLLHVRWLHLQLSRVCPSGVRLLLVRPSRVRLLLLPLAELCLALQ